MATRGAGNTSGSEDPLLFRLEKRQLMLRASEPVTQLLDPLCFRAGESGCGEVGRDELFAALLVAASKAADDELRSVIEAYRLTRLSALQDST